MLVLTREVGENIIIGPIGEDVYIGVSVARIHNNSVRIGITAPPSVRIMRESIAKTLGMPTIEQLNKNQMLSAKVSGDVQ